MWRRIALLCLVAVLLSGCSILLKERTKGQEPQAEGPQEPGLRVNVMIAERLEEQTDGAIMALKPNIHTFTAGQPYQPGFVVRIDGLSPGAHTLKLRFYVKAASADRLESVEKLFALQSGQQPSEAQQQLFSVRKMLADGWWSEATRQVNVTGHPGYWAYHSFVNDLLLLAWEEGVHDVEVMVDGKVVHTVRVRFLTTESMQKLLDEAH